MFLDYATPAWLGTAEALVGRATAVPGARPDFTSLEGYLARRPAIEALRRCAGQISRERFLQVISDEEPFDLDGRFVALAPNLSEGLAA